jgi:hypothetical protein
MASSGLIGNSFQQVSSIQIHFKLYEFSAMYMVSGSLPSLLLLLLYVSKIDRRLFLGVVFAALAAIEFFLGVGTNVLAVKELIIIIA